MSFLKLMIPALLIAGAIYAQDAPALIIPDFSGTALPKEIKFNNPNWKTDHGILRSPDHREKGLSGFAIERNDLGDYEVQFRVRKLGQNPKDQHFGFSPRNGVSIYTRGKLLVQQIPERKIHTGFGKMFQREIGIGEDAEWTDFLITVKGPSLAIRINNELVAERKDLPEKTDKFTFYVYYSQLEIMDFSLKILESEKDPELKADTGNSPNSVLNASFEQCTLDGLPDYWGVPAWGLVEPEVIVKYNTEWVKRFGSDSSTAFHGQRSLRIVNTENGKAKLSYTLWSCFQREKKDTVYTLSAYMKSDAPEMKIMMRGFGAPGGAKNEKLMTLTTDWQRYELTFTPTATGNGPLMFIPYSKGTYWIDAVQLEPGEKPTPFQLANAERRLATHEGNPDKPLYEVPVHKTPFIEESPVMDGLLNDPVWGKVPPVSLNTTSGREPQEKTSARIFYTAAGIWIGIDADEAGSDQIKCKKTRRDEYVWGDPSIELFIDSKLTRATYHQLAFNVDGVQYDNNIGDVNWNGKWQVKTARKKDGSGWTAELFLPFSDMNIDHNNTDLWGFNICRNNPRKGEISTWAPTYGGFHVPLRFGQLEIRSDIQKRFIAGIKDPVLQYAGAGKNELSAIVFNNTGAKVSANLEIKVVSEESGKALAFQKQVDLADKQESRVVLGMVPGSQTERFTIEMALADGEREVSSAKTTLSAGNLLSILTQYNYCTSEETLLLQGTTGANSELQARSKLETEIRDGEGNSVYRTALPIRNGRFEAKLPVGEWKNGKYKASCRLIEDGKEIAVAEIPFSKLAPSKNEVKIDRFRRITLINGKPYLPLGFFWEGNLTPELIEFLAEGGVNFIHSYTKISDAVLEAGKKHGVMFELDIRNRKDGNMELDVISKYKAHPAILTWYTYDEAFAGSLGQKDPGKILSDIDLVREADPYRPAVLLDNSHGMNYMVQKGLEWPGDIPTLDYYAWPPNGNVQLWNNYSRTLMKMGEKEGRPGWAIPFVAGYGYHTSRDILPQEQEYQTYICLINGCRAIAYWASFPKAPSSFEKIKQLFKEIRQIQDPLISLEEVPKIATASPDIRFTLKKYDGALYLITVNESRSPIRARFDLSAIPAVKNAEVLFEDRNLPLQGDSLEDTWLGFQRHVYKITPR